jgi:hypothetical protein
MGQEEGLLLLCWQNKIDEDFCVVRAPRSLGAADGCCPAGDAVSRQGISLWQACCWLCIPALSASTVSSCAALSHRMLQQNPHSSCCCRCLPCQTVEELREQRKQEADAAAAADKDQADDAAQQGKQPQDAAGKRSKKRKAAAAPPAGEQTQ